MYTFLNKRSALTWDNLIRMLWLLIRYSVSPSDSTTGTGTADREDKPNREQVSSPSEWKGSNAIDLPSRSWLFLLGFLRAQCQSYDGRLIMHQKWWFSSVQFSCSVVSDSLRPHESKHTRPPCQSPTPVIHPNSCPSSQWCHPAISSSGIPFSSCPQSLPASESFLQWVNSLHEVAKVLEFQH